MEKKRRKIFLMISFGVPLLSFMLMFIGYQKKVDLTSFASMFMYLPAMGVMLAVLMTDKNKLIPKRFFSGYITFSLIMIIVACSSVFFPKDFWTMVSGLVSICGSVLVGLFLFTEKKKKRLAYGLKGRHWKISFALIGLFLILYIFRSSFLFLLSGQLAWLASHFSKTDTWITLGITLALYLINWIMYFGEEYGWRYYFQPFLQKRFGTLKGVLILGLLWGLWHAPLNFFYYVKPEIGIFSLLGQIMNCIGLGIFFAYCYIKTENIWLVSILHFLNNNLMGLFINPTASNATVTNSQMGASILLTTGLGLIIFSSVALSKTFKQPSQLPTLEERLIEVSLSE